MIQEKKLERSGLNNAIECLQLLLADPTGEHKDKAQKILGPLNPFQEGGKIIYSVIQAQYAEDRIPTLQTVLNLFEDKNSQFHLDMQNMYVVQRTIDTLKEYKAEKYNIDHSLACVLRDYKIREILRIQEMALKIRTEGITIKGKLLQGFDEAERYESSEKAKFLDLTHRGTKEGSPQDTEAMRREYEKSKSNDNVIGTCTGLPSIDLATYGGKGGEFWLVSAYAQEGKSQMLINMSYHAAIEEGKTVVYASAEMPYSQVARRFWARHTRHDKFKSRAFLTYQDIRYGKLNPADEDLYLNEVAEDFGHPKENGYGKIIIIQCPGWSIGDLKKRLEELNKETPIDAVYIDYLQLLTSSLRIREPRQDLEEMFRETKRLALSFGSGEQLLVVSAHQIRREDRKKFAETKRKKKPTDPAETEDQVEEEYFLWSLGSTAEAERSPDVCIWLLRLPAYKEKAEVKIGQNKNRDGDCARPQFYFENYAASYIGPLEEDISKKTQSTIDTENGIAEPEDENEVE